MKETTSENEMVPYKILSTARHAAIKLRFAEAVFFMIRSISFASFAEKSPQKIDPSPITNTVTFSSCFLKNGSTFFLTFKAILAF